MRLETCYILPSKKREKKQKKLNLKPSEPIMCRKSKSCWCRGGPQLNMTEVTGMLIRERKYVHKQRKNDMQRPAQREGGGLTWRCTTTDRRSTKLPLIPRFAREKSSSTSLGRSKESFINILNTDQDGTQSGPLL